MTDEQAAEITRLRQENARLRAENAELRPRVSDLSHRLRLALRREPTPATATIETGALTRKNRDHG